MFLIYSKLCCADHTNEVVIMCKTLLNASAIKCTERNHFYNMRALRWVVVSSGVPLCVAQTRLLTTGQQLRGW